MGAKSANTNLLVLAGPGSGKTRVVAHRGAYLLRGERVRPERMLVACFNRHAALQLRHHPQTCRQQLCISCRFAQFAIYSSLTKQEFHSHWPPCARSNPIWWQ